MNQRMIILETMLLIEEGKAGSDKIINQVLDKYDYLKKQERSFIKRVLEGSLERRIEIDYIIDRYSRTKVSAMKPVVRAVLRMSVYQLKYMDSVPESAVCNEAVKLVKSKGFAGLGGFVNGVLRNIARNLDKIEYPDEDTKEGMSVKYSCPIWLTEQLMCEQGPENTHKILEASLKPADIFIRTNLSRISVEQLKERIAEEGLGTAPAPYLPYAIRLTDVDSVARINAFGVGLFQIQDIGSMLVTHVAGIRKNDVVLDVCAAPGGKSMHALDILDGSGHLYAFDISDTKLEMIMENAARSGHSNVDIIMSDAAQYNERLEETADVLIADLPCSGLGVMGRKNDIKYNMTPEKEASLAGLQKEILANVSRYVKPGGILVYSTCTIHRAENEDNAEWITKNLPFEPVSLDEYLPRELRCATSARGYIQLIPGVCDCDGFFISKFRRVDRAC